MNEEIKALIERHKKLLRSHSRRPNNSWKYAPLSVQQFKAKEIRKRLHDECGLSWREINEETNK